MFKPKAIYYEKEIVNYPLGIHLMEQYKEIPKVEIENHNNIEELRKKQNSEFPNLKRNLIIGIRKTRTARRPCAPQAGGCAHAQRSSQP